MFDLAEVRVRLDQMTERILSRLKDRSRFPRNPSVYRPDGVPVTGRSGISFLEFSLEGLETYHASLGRYSFPDQYPLFSTNPHDSAVQRAIASSDDPRIEIPIKDHLLAFYSQTIELLCREGDDPSTFGETVYVDADLIHLLHERINIGRHIAAAKAAANPGLDAIIPDSTALSNELRDAAREEVLLQAVEATARRYQLDPAVARKVFRWIIDETLALEVSYLQGLAASQSLGALRS
jgi:chorismate mutase